MYHKHAGCIAASRQRSVSRRTIYRYHRATGRYGVDTALVALADAMATDTAPPTSNWTRQAERVAQLLAPVLEPQTEWIAPPPLLSGHDLIKSLLLSPGPRIGEILDRLREEQAAGEIHSREEAIAWAQRLLGDPTL
jgi:hypothetical protein